MTVDPAQYEDLSKLLDEVVNPRIGSAEDAEVVAELCEDLLIDEVTDVIVESRSPRLYIFGRSGAGKSSLINALANKEVAEVGAVKPTTVDAQKYEIQFPDHNAKWELVDSRGLFESAAADDGPAIDTIKKLKSDLERHNPDLLLHVMTPDQIRAGDDDFEVVRRLDNAVIGGLPPRIVCLNKVDNYMAAGGHWPPEQNTALTENIEDALKLVADILSLQGTQPYNYDAPVQGLVTGSREIIGVFPTYVKERPYWNLPTIIEFLCEHLPAEAILQFAQAQRRERIMRQLARKQTIAVAEGMNQLSTKLVVNPNKPVVIGLQEYLVVLIGSFAGEELSSETADKYITQTELTARNVFSTVSDIAKDIALSVSGRDNKNLCKQTYGIGRSAEVYFFDGEFIPAIEFESEWSEGMDIADIDGNPH